MPRHCHVNLHTVCMLIHICVYVVCKHVCLYQSYPYIIYPSWSRWQASLDHAKNPRMIHGPKGRIRWTAKTIRNSTRVNICIHTYRPYYYCCYCHYYYILVSLSLSSWFMILLLFSPGFLSKSIIRASGSKVSSASLDETAALSQGREDELSGTRRWLENGPFRWFVYWNLQWIGLRENLQETMVFTIKYRGFLWIFPSSNSMKPPLARFSQCLMTPDHDLWQPKVDGKLGNLETMEETLSK